jgi:hypothetical protein
VNEAQKAALLPIVVARGSGLRMTFWIVAIIGWSVFVSAAWAISIPHPQPTWLDLLGIGAVTLFPIYIAIVIGLFRRLERLKPILASATETRERFTNWDRWRATADALPLKVLAAVSGLLVFGAASLITSLVIRNDHHPLFSDPTSIVLAACALLTTLLASMYSIAMIRRLASTIP